MPASGAAGAASPLHPARGVPGLGVVRLNQGGDGIAYVARLLHRVFTELVGSPPPLVELAPGSSGGVRISERLRFVARLSAHGLRTGPDWWMFNHVGIAQAQQWVPRPLRRPYAVMLNGIEVWDPALSEPRQAVLRRAAVRIAISHYTATRFASLFPALQPVVPCPLGLLPERAHGEVDAELLAAATPRSVLIVGRMSASERYKGHDELIEAWPRVLEAVPDAQLLVAGGGDDVERLRAKAADTGVGHRVRFLGFVPDATLDALFRRVAAFAMPSRGEGFGLVYLQAMEAGLPCIGSTADAAGDIILDGETGLLVEPGDRAALSSAVVRLLRSPELRTAYGRAGERRFHAEFTYQRFRDRLMPILAATFA